MPRRRHTWSARRRLNVGPFYQVHSARADDRGLRHGAGAWHLKVVPGLHLNLRERTYHWDNPGLGSTSGPVPAWRVVLPAAVVVAVLASWKRLAVLAVLGYLGWVFVTLFLFG